MATLVALPRATHLSEMEYDLPPNDRSITVAQAEVAQVDPVETLRNSRVSGRGRKAHTDVPENVDLAEHATLARTNPSPAAVQLITTSSAPPPPPPPPPPLVVFQEAVSEADASALPANKRTRVKKRQHHPDMVNPALITDKGTLSAKVAGARSTVQVTPAILNVRRRHQLSAARALQFPRLVENTWRPPNMERPIETRAQLNLDLATTKGPGLFVDSRWLGRDAITGLNINQLRAHDPDMANRTLPMSDFHERFNRETPLERDELHARLLSKMYGFQAAMYEAGETGRNPSLRTSSSSALLGAILSNPPMYDRIKAMIEVKNEDGHLRQNSLHSIPEMSMSEIKSFLRPPQLQGERACVAAERCTARNCAHDTDLAITSPLQWGPSNQRAQKHREQVSMLQLREYLSPEQEKICRETKQPPKQHGFCIVCNIHAVNIKYFASLRPCTTERDYMWMVDVVHRYEQGDITHDQMQRELHDTTRRCDIEELTRQFGGYQPFKVRIGPGEFPAAACLNIVVGTRETAALYPFPMFDNKLFRWTKAKDQWIMIMEFSNFCFGAPNDNPWGVSQLWPAYTSREGLAAAEERVPILALGRFYEGLAQLELTDDLLSDTGPEATSEAATSPPLKLGAEGARDLIDNQFVLCPFDQTVEAFKMGRLQTRTPREYNAVWFPVHPDKGCMPPDEPLPCPDYAILAALAHRLSFAYTEYHRLMNVRRMYFSEGHPDSKPSPDGNKPAADEADQADPDLTAKFGDMASFYEYLDILHTDQCSMYDSQRVLRRVCFQWKLYLTTHFALAHYLWLRPMETIAWTDVALMSPPDAHTLCPYEAFYPEEQGIISVGMLPRLTHTIANLGWFSETCEKRVPLAHLLRKSMHIICAARGWFKILEEYCTKYDGIVELLHLCTMVSCLRLYPHSDECFTMNMAMNIYHHCSVTVQDLDKSREWREQHSILMWFALREYQMFMVRQLPPLYYVLTRYNNLPAVAASCSAGLDHACQIFVKYGSYVDPSHNIDVNLMLRQGYYNSEQLRFAFKVFKISFLEIAHGMLNTLFDQHFFTDRAYCFEEMVPDDVAEVMHEYVARLDPRTSSIFQQAHFVHWNIHPYLLRLLFACKDNYEIGCEADHKTRKQLEGIFSCAPRDFHLLHMLVTVMVRHCRIQLIPLSAETAEAQERALRLRHGIPDFRVPSPELYTNYFCPVCECVCSFITPPCWSRSNRTDFSGFSIVNAAGDAGHDHARWDVLLGRLVCRRPTMVKGQSFQEAKQQHTRAGGRLVYRGHDRTDPNAPQREAREARKIRFGLECRGTPLIPVCFIGAALRIGSRIIVACETDFAKTELSLGTFGPNGVTCTAHTHDPWATYRPYSLLYDRMGPIPLPSNPNLMPDNLIFATRGYNWSIIDKCDVQANTWCSHFGVVKQCDALLRLVQARSVPNGTRGGGGAVSKSKRGENSCTLIFHAIRTHATVGKNSFVDALVSGNYQAEATPASDVTSHYANNCYFCVRKRPKNDSKWGVTVVWGQEQQFVLIFMCERCTRYVPSIKTRQVAPHFTLSDLMTMKRTDTPVLC